MYKRTTTTKRSKYNARKYEANGQTFDSKKEYTRYLTLLEMEQNGQISDLRLQVPFTLLPLQRVEGEKSLRAVKYIADFVYTQADGKTVVEDVKGYRGGGAYAVFVIKKKLLYFTTGLFVHEV